MKYWLNLIAKSIVCGVLLFAFLFGMVYLVIRIP